MDAQDCEECGMRHDVPPDADSDPAPDGTCHDCGRLLVDPAGLFCAACQPATVPLEPEEV
jgi:hypothetical protein